MREGETRNEEKPNKRIATESSKAKTISIEKVKYKTPNTKNVGWIL